MRLMSSHFVQASIRVPASRSSCSAHRPSGLQALSLSLCDFVSASREEADLLSEKASSATSPWLQDTPPFCHAESGASF